MLKDTNNLTLQSLLWLVRLIPISMILVLVAAHFLNPIHWGNHDNAMLLLVTNDWLNGAALYTEQTLVTPFAIIFYSLAPTLLAEIALDALCWSNILVWVIAGLGVWLVLKQDEPAGKKIAYAGSYLAVVAFPLTRAIDFGNREHIFITVLIPYILARMLGGKSSRLQGVFACLIGLATGFKPQFLLLALPWLLLKNDQNNKRDWIYFATGLLLPLIVLGVSNPDSFVAFYESFFHFVVFGGYRYYAQQFWQANPTFTYTFIGLTILYGFTYYRILSLKLSYKVQLQRQLITLSFALASVVIQSKYWSYHFVPLFTLTTIFILFNVYEAPGRFSPKIRITSLTVAVAICCTLALSYNIFSTRKKATEIAASQINESHSTVMTLSTAVHQTLNLSFSHNIKFLRPFDHFVQLPQLVAENRQDEISALRQQTLEKISSLKPDVLLLYNRTDFLRGKRFASVLFGSDLPDLPNYTSHRKSKWSNLIVYTRK